MKGWRRLACLFFLCAIATGTAAAQEAFYKRAADCATANQLRVLDALPSWKSDDQTLNQFLLRQIELGLSFAGTAYKQGLRDPLAADLLRQSKEHLLLLAPQDRDQFRQSCDRESQALWDAATGFERWVVRTKAKSGLDRMLSDFRAAKETR